jgi:hypothetical protein
MEARGRWGKINGASYSKRDLPTARRRERYAVEDQPRDCRRWTDE